MFEDVSFKDYLACLGIFGCTEKAKWPSLGIAEFFCTKQSRQAIFLMNFALSVYDESV